MKEFVFQVSGMHCSACKHLVEDILSEYPGIKSVNANLGDNEVVLTGNFGEQTEEEVAKTLTVPIKSHGYVLSVEKQNHDAKWHEFKIALPVALAFVAFFIILQKIGIVNLVSSESMTYGTAFLIGVIASLSTCMAVVGGLVLSMSANFAKSGDKIRPQIMFHVGRLASFFIFGGVIGIIGSTWKLGGIGILVLGIVVGVIMLILGLNLLDVFPWMKRLQPTLPSFVARRVTNLKTINHTLTPILIGVLTFILPCGFTQSMQIYSLSLGSFIGGALTMLSFALGTLPVLALLSFGAAGFHDKIRSGIFFKSAGLVVIFFALLNLLTALTGAGIIPPLFNL